MEQTHGAHHGKKLLAAGIVLLLAVCAVLFFFVRPDASLNQKVTSLQSQVDTLLGKAKDNHLSEADAKELTNLKQAVQDLINQTDNDDVKAELAALTQRIDELSAGSTAASGSQGPAGQQGIQGTPGIQGPIGLTGPQGIQGLQGDQGIQGLQGPAGADGNACGTGTCVSLQPAGPLTQEDGSISVSGSGLFGGNVGIGTASPATPLHVLSTHQTGLTIERSSSANSNLQFKNTSGSTFAGLLPSGQGFGVGATNDLGSANFTVLNGGNVGIGTTSPGAKLQINTGAAATVGLTIQGAISQTASLQEWRNSSGGVAGSLSLYGGGENGILFSSPFQFQFAGSAVFRNGIRSDANSNNQILLESHWTGAKPLVVRGALGQTANLSEWQTSTGTVLNVINAAGNVGIGTTSPGALLQVGIDTTTAAGGMKFGTDTNLYRVGAGRLKSDTQIESPLFYAYGAVAGSTGLQTAVSGDAQSRFKVTYGGAISFGNGTNPQDTNLYRSAAATLKTDGALVVNNTGADSVKLTTTGQVTTFYSGQSTRLGYSGLGAGLWLGTADGTYDTGLYRSLPGILATNGSFIVGTNLNVSGTSTLDSLTVTGAATFNGTLTVTGAATFQSTLSVTGTATFNGNIIINGHIVTGGAAPTTAVHANAGAGAACTVSGTDTTGTITIVAGAAPSPGTQCTITFAAAFGSAPRVVAGPKGAAAAPLQTYSDNAGTTSFDLGTALPLVSGTYTFEYIAAQ